MVQAISSLKICNSRRVSFNNQSSMSSIFNHSADMFYSSKNVSFKGNLTSEAIEVTKKIAKELPSVKKSLIAAVSDLKHIIGDGQGVVHIPLEEVSVAKETILDANNIIAPHIADLAGDALKEGVSATGHEAAGAIAEGAGAAIKENAGHGVVEGVKEAGHGLWEGIKEAITHIL